MTEDQARQVVLVQALESAGAGDGGKRAAHWGPDDRDWATHQAVATQGEQATPERFVLARTAAALTRLLPRDADAQRWLQRRVWHPAWLLLVAAFGLLGGLAVDQLGPPQQVNLLAPAVWAVVAWNVLVYAALLGPSSWPRWRPGWRPAASAWWLGAGSGGATANRLWAPLATALALQRLSLLMHTAAATVALGLIAGLYLRGLVLDYRAGWQSTFAEASQVQTTLGLLLAPASALTAIAVPDVGPLRLLPGHAATASAAPWIHLLAASLLLWVVLPRTGLALHAAWQAGRRARRFALPLNTPYFEALHPIMRRAPPSPVRLLWLQVPMPATDSKVVQLLDLSFDALTTPQLLHQSAHGDELQLHPTPADLIQRTALARPWWSRMSRRFLNWPDARQRQLSDLQTRTDAVLLCLAPGATAPDWLSAFGRPVLVLRDAPAADAPQLSLQALNDGWLRGGRLIDALVALLPGDARMQRLGESWRAQQQVRMDSGLQVLADGLARMACARAEVTSTGDPAPAESAARASLAHTLESQWRETLQQLSQAIGAAQGAAGSGWPGPGDTGAATLHARLPEGRLALMGGAATGALTGLKADLLSGGLTMGAGLVTGLVLGALGSAGVARGINAARGTERSFAAWDAAVMDRVAQQLLAQHLVLAHELPLPQALTRVSHAWSLPAARSVLTDIWRSRDLRADAILESQRLSQALRPWLAAAFRRAMGGP